MENRNVWLACGEAMDATVEGERMIAHRMADGIADAWHRLLTWLVDHSAHFDTPRPLPPM